MPCVSTEFIAIGCNRTAQAAAWGAEGTVAFGADKLIALYDPLDKYGKGVYETLKGHTDRVNCVSFLEYDQREHALISGSADMRVKVWKKNSSGQWINSATLEFHKGAIEALATIHVPLGEYGMDIIALGSSDGKISIWERTLVDENTDQVTCIQTMDRRTKYPLSLALSLLPGTQVPVLACGQTDKKIAIFAYQHSKKQFEHVHALQGHDNWVKSLSFATYTGDRATQSGNHTLRPGDLMLASASQDKYIRLWKISPHTPTTTDVSESPLDTLNQLQSVLQSNDLGQDDGHLSTKAHRIKMEDPKDPSLWLEYSIMFEALLMGHDDWVSSVSWARPSVDNGHSDQPMRLISSSSDKSMMIWSPDPDSGVWMNEVRMGDIGGGTYLGFCGALLSPDGMYALSFGANGSFHLWKDVSTQDDHRWAPCVAISGHIKSVEDIAWDPKSRFLVSTSLDQTTRLFAPWRQGDVETWHEMGRPQVHGYDLKCIAFINDWRFASGADEKVLRVFDAPKSCVESLAALMSEPSILQDVESRPVGANLPALGLSNKAVFEGDDQGDDEDDLPVMESHAKTFVTPTLQVEVSHPPFEEHLLQHTLWPEVEKLYGHGYELVAVDASHDGKYLASTCKATTAEHAVVRLMNAETWKEAPTKIAAHALTVTRVRFSHNDRWLLAVSRDRVWSLSERVEGDDACPYKLVAKAKAHARIIWDAAWSHDDRLFVTGSRDKTLKLWAQVNNEWANIATIKCAEAITAVAFAPRLQDNKYILAAGLENGNIQLFSGDAENGSTTWTAWCAVDDRQAHGGVVRSMAWRITPQGTLQFASAGEDHCVRIYNALP